MRVVRWPAVTIPHAPGISVVVCPSDGGFTASAHELNIAMVGESAEEALALLDEHVLAVHELLSASPVLGPEPARQLAILNRAIPHAPGSRFDRDPAVIARWKRRYPNAGPSADPEVLREQLRLLLGAWRALDRA